jgi:hypothetical protein
MRETKTKFQKLSKGNESGTGCRHCQRNLVAEVQKCTENITTTENPGVLIEPTFSFAYLRHVMIKIAYEFAFLWLGETYLDDPSAAELRAAISKPDLASTDGVLGYVGDAQGCDAFNFWTPNEAHHLAYASVINRRIAIAIRVFDIHAAVILVTNDAAPLLSG